MKPSTAEQTQELARSFDHENLVNLAEKTASPFPGGDLNAKLASLEGGLGSLVAEVKSADQRLRKTHSELKVQGSHTDGRIDAAHAELKEIQSAYQHLSTQSGTLAQQTDSLAQDFNLQRQRVDQRFNQGSQEAKERHDELSAVQQELRGKTASLETKTERLAEILESRLAKLTSMIEKVEQRFMERLADVVEQSESRDQQLSRQIDQSAADGRAQLKDVDGRLTDKINKVNSDLVDANDQISGLHKQTKGLTEQAEDLEQQVLVVDTRADHLDERSDELEVATEAQGAEIIQLNQTARQQMVRGLTAVAIIAIGLTGLAIYQWQGQSVSNDKLNTLKGETTTQFVAQDASLKTETRKLVDELTSQQRQIADLKRQLNEVNDKSDSAMGRLSAMSPLGQFGADSVIRGPQWLSQQSSAIYMIQLVSVVDQQKLYETAERWGHYLTAPLAYYAMGEGSSKRYILLYGGYADMNSAQQSLFQLPIIDAWTPPGIVEMVEVQKYL